MGSISSRLIIDFIFCLIAFIGSPVFANGLYFEDTTATDIYDLIISGSNGYGCAGCHQTSGTPAVCTGTTVSAGTATLFMKSDVAIDNTTKGIATYEEVAACIGLIKNKVSSGVSFGDRMPPGSTCVRSPGDETGCLTTVHANLLTSWDTNGEPLAPPTTTGLSVSSISKTGATLSANFNPNVWALSSVYYNWILEYGTTTSYGTTVTSGSGSGSGLRGLSNISKSSAVSETLTCGTTYQYRAKITNPQNTAITDESTGSFATTACTVPTINEGASSSQSIAEDNDPLGVQFALTLNVTDTDLGPLDTSINFVWSIEVPAEVVGTSTASGTATATGSGASKAILFDPAANFVGMVDFTVRVQNTSTGLFADHVVTVTMVEVNDAPEIVESPGGDMAADVPGPLSAMIAEDGTLALTLFATDPDTDDSALIWTVFSGPASGLAVANGTGASQAVTYMPVVDFFGDISFTVQASDGATADTVRIDVTVTSVNDPPVITAIADQTATENQLISINSVVTDPDDSSFTWTFDSGQLPDMLISSTGVITWTPPQTGTFNQSYGPIVIKAADGEPLSDTESFFILVSPPDGDSDQVADYNDLCLTISDSTNADNDGDGTAGSDGGANDGGDACDLDDDNDGMPDSFENANGLDPFDAADANEDTDGDGVSNLDEFLAGTSPGVADKTFDATGYYTPIALTPPDPKSINAAATGVRADNFGPYRPGKTPITWTAFDSSDDNLGSIIETLKINPLLSFAANQITAEGSTVTVTASLNGSAPTYPVTVNYAVSGTAGTGDHDATSGSFEIADPDRAASFTFDVTKDSTTEGEETVLFTFTDASNAVIGNRSSHTVTIVEGNILPQIELRLRQSGAIVSSAFVSEGLVTVEATVTDVNSDQTHNLDWSSTDNSLVAPGNSGTASWTFTPVAGNFLIDLEVTDSGTPALSNRVSRVLNIAATAPVLTAVDSDDDGTNDDVEGFGDSDSDGVPDYLDANDGASGETNLIPSQTVDFAASFLVETEPGLTITLGNTASAANNFGALVTDSDIEDFGSASGGEPLGATDDFEHIGGVYDFEVKGMVPAAVVSVVIPLQSAIPVDAEYRKFHADKGWVEFVVDENNQLATASGELGVCPEPGHESYETGLIYLHNCLQLTIEDGGANDADGIANGVIKDPGSVGVELSDPSIPEVEGGGRLHPLMLFWLLSLLMFQYHAKYPLRDKNH